MAEEEIFGSLLTDIGNAQISNALALGEQVDIIEMAVGDGENAAYYQPVATQTALKNEVFRGPVNNKYISPNSPVIAVFELAIPASAGPFMIREAGVFDADGNLIAVGKLPETYKTTPAQGASTDFLLKLEVLTAGVDQLEILVDPSVALATHQKVSDDIAAHEAADDPHPTYAVPQATETVVGKVELATIAEAKTGADSRRAVTPEGLGAALAGERKSAMLERLLSAMRDITANPAMNAKPETYENLSGVDGASANYVHDAAGAYLHNPGSITTRSSAAEWEGDKANTAFSGDDIDCSKWRQRRRDSAIKSHGAFGADVDFQFTFVRGSGPYVGFFETTEDASFDSSNSGTGGMIRMRQSWWIDPSRGYLYKAGDQIDKIKATKPNDVIKIARENDTFKLYVNNVLAYTWASKSTSEIRFALGVSDAWKINDVSWTVPGAASDMEIISRSLEAFSEPANGYLLGLWESVDAVTYGADVLADMSKDDGATWEDLRIEKIGAATIDVNGVATVVDVVFGEVEFAASGDKTMRTRLRGQNAKHVKFHGTIMDAE